MTCPAIVGSGLIGRAWPISFARSAHQVVLWDEDSAASRKALDFICGGPPELARNELLDDLDPGEVFSALRIEIEYDFAAAICGADQVQESMRERLETKITLFGRLNSLTPPAIQTVSSNGSLACPSSQPPVSLSAAPISTSPMSPRWRGRWAMSITEKEKPAASSPFTASASVDCRSHASPAKGRAACGSKFWSM